MHPSVVEASSFLPPLIMQGLFGAGNPFASMADMDQPGSPRSLPQPDRAMLQEPHSLLPQESHGLLPSEPPGMLPQTEGPANLYPPPYMALSGLASAGFQAQPYALPQLGQLFPPNPAHPSTAPGLGLLAAILTNPTYL